MNKHTAFTREELDWVIDYIKKQDSLIIDVSAGSPIRNIAGDYFNDLNMYHLFADLHRMGIVHSIKCPDDSWIPKVGFTYIIAFVIDKNWHRDEVIKNRIENDNQIRLL